MALNCVAARGPRAAHHAARTGDLRLAHGERPAEFLATFSRSRKSGQRALAAQRFLGSRNRGDDFLEGDGAAWVAFVLVLAMLRQSRSAHTDLAGAAS